MPTKTALKQQRKQAKTDALVACNSSQILTLQIIQTVLMVTDIVWVVELLKREILSGRRIEQEAQDALCEASAEIRESLAESLLRRCNDLKDDPTQARRQAFFFHFAMSLRNLNNRKPPVRALSTMLDEADLVGIATLFKRQVVDHEGNRLLMEFAEHDPEKGELIAELLRKEASAGNDITPSKAGFLLHLAERLEDRARLAILPNSQPSVTKAVISVDSTPLPISSIERSESVSSVASVSDVAMNEDESEQEADESSAEYCLDADRVAEKILQASYLNENAKREFCELFVKHPEMVEAVIQRLHELTEPDITAAKALHMGGEPEDVRRSNSIRRRVYFLRVVLGNLFRAAATGGVLEAEGESAVANPFPVKEPNSQAA